jgi:plasmid stabilization system protein ParE
VKIEITRSAANDIADGHLFYEGQEAGVGYYFEKSVMSDIRSLVIYAGIHELHFEGYHRMVTHHFPYAIFYRVEDEVVRVFAVLNTRRDPERISERLN